MSGGRGTPITSRLRTPWRAGRPSAVRQFPSRGVGIHTDELPHRALQTAEQREVDIHAQRRNVAPARILDADGRALGLAAIGKRICVVRNHLRIFGIRDARQPELRGRSRRWISSAARGLPLHARNALFHRARRRKRAICGFIASG